MDAGSDNALEPSKRGRSASPAGDQTRGEPGSPPRKKVAVEGATATATAVPNRPAVEVPMMDEEAGMNEEMAFNAAQTAGSESVEPAVKAAAPGDKGDKGDKEAVDVEVASPSTRKDQEGDTPSGEGKRQKQQVKNKGKGWQGKSGGVVGEGKEGKVVKDGGALRDPKEWVRRGRGTRPEGEIGADKEDGEQRLPKKRVAVLVGYCGTGYSGMQIQTHGSQTIEGDIFAALVKAGAVSEDNADDHRKVDVQRAARTDAGVHAAGNVISLKMILDPPLPDGIPSLTAHVNLLLPDQIRMWGFVRTLKSFQARTACDSRIYEYLLPSYCLLPPASTDALSKRLDESSPGWRGVLGVSAEFADAAPAPALAPSGDGAEIGNGQNGVEGEGEGAAEGAGVGAGAGVGEDEETKVDPKARGEYERRRTWRVDPDTLKRFRELIAEFKGTHNFHNYTVGKPFNDRTVKRYMIRLEVKDPVVYSEIEWISVQIHGQSFMLHQIRKMISLAMLACRTASPPALIPETFGPKRIHIPKAPPLGLLLEAPQFKTYNDKLKSNSHNVPVDEQRDPVDFGLYKEEMHAFKVRYIYEKLRQEELEFNVFHKWLRQVDCSASAQFSFLNSSGTIPPEAEAKPKETKPEAEEPSEGAGAGAGEGKTKAGKGKPKEEFEEVESEDEELDREQLRRGELEG